LWVALALLFTAAGCGKTISEDDCRAIGANLREAWQAETKDLKTTPGPVTDKASGVIKSEGEKLVADWSSECRNKLQGREVDGKELRCLHRAKTLAELRKCSEAR
jgi:hypothetical protein